MVVDEYALALERAVAESQEVLARYIQPRSEISDGEVINALLDILDDSDLVNAMKAHGAGKRKAAVREKIDRLIAGVSDTPPAGGRAKRKKPRIHLM
jgi:hypothetical protein